MEAVHRTLRYLKATTGKRLKFRKIEKRSIEACIDSNWQGLLLIENLPLNIVLLCGAILLLGEVRSKKQGLVPRAVLK